MPDQNEGAPLRVPQDVEAEQAVLGSILLATDPQDLLADIMTILEPSDFYRTAHRLIYSAILALDETQRAIDILTITDELDKDNQVENVGGMAYLTELASSVPVAGNALYYARIVRERSVRRNMIDTLQDSLTQTYEGTDSVDDAVADLSTKLDLINGGEKSADFKNIADVVNKSFEQIEQNSRTDETVTGLASGFPALDNLTTGFHEGEMIIIAARPAVGKTAFVLNIAQKVAVADPTLPVVIFSLEMPDTSLVNRMLAAEGNINSQHMRTGQLEAEEWNSLAVATGSLARTNIYIDDTPGIKVTEIRSKLRRLYKREGRLGLVIIDYLQLIEGTRSEGRQQEVSAISRAIKMMAMEMNVPIIALSQLSRSVEQRQDKRPMLSDIRESGSIEQDADIVAFLYRDDYYEKSNDDLDNQNDPRDEEQQDIGEIEVILEKNRSGARGTARLLFVKSYNKFSNIDFHNEEPGGFG
ncbi:replicative DNA helicase [Weissella paramesenteroides]|uniref:replicative DNA helicase n=1 Tax=Weissella paramesenteroides TaxID=1249 RepID=UPI00103D048A|nr:replicative DNA helicase [Weissella paramesenteroides]MCM6765021.1 replicative DNA helicase [Weissella paramesenteroides]MCM6767870.1 replicative DNA helicase [Weissella paramesenteroides]MCM6768857.1 replicative DNA helicase [Weissella paramesenteroides]MCM6770960.1 replicative DNA helicase [Weissella paramesenteroides]MCM6780881.1 replicative DNA helicase [Weissella paramesenteroides]